MSEKKEEQAKEPVKKTETPKEEKVVKEEKQEKKSSLATKLGVEEDVVTFVKQHIGITDEKQLETYIKTHYETK